MKLLKNLAKAAVFCLAMVWLLNLGPQVFAKPAAVSLKDPDPETGYAEERIAQLEEQVKSLTEDKARLTEEVEKYRAQADEDCILVLRYEQLFLSGIFGDAIVIERAVQEIAVSRELYDSCRTGDDITRLELHRIMTCGGLSDTRVIVENKYIRA